MKKKVVLFYNIKLKYMIEVNPHKKYLCLGAGKTYETNKFALTLKYLLMITTEKYFYIFSLILKLKQ